jgi:hypothetical protein
MTPTRRRLVLLGILLLAGLIAFPLRPLIYETIVIPAAFIAWNLNLLYRSYPQWVWWAVVAFVVFIMIVFSLVPRPPARRTGGEKPRPPQGAVENLATGLQKAEEGIYFRWVVANRLGKLAYHILRHRESGAARPLSAPLRGADWEPGERLQRYLEAGLHGSFADYPQDSRFPAARRETPLDFNVEEAVDFLESQVENGRYTH